MKKCKECNADFTPLNPKGIFCSLSCRQKDYRKKLKMELQQLRSVTVTVTEKPIVGFRVGDKVSGGGIIKKVKNTKGGQTAHVKPETKATKSDLEKQFQDEMDKIVNNKKK